MEITGFGSRRSRKPLDRPCSESREWKSVSNPNQFVLLKLEVKKSDRETIIGQYSALGMSSGSDSNATIPFKSERIRAGLYKVVVDDMKPGEYCFLASSGMASTGMAAAYGVGMATSADIFDFGVSID